jgi:hypothetical protein
MVMDCHNTLIIVTETTRSRFSLFMEKIDFDTDLDPDNSAAPYHPSA